MIGGFLGGKASASLTESAIDRALAARALTQADVAISIAGSDFDLIDGLMAIGTLSLKPPKNKTLPVISGTVREGQTLTATTGTWKHLPTSFTFQWLADGQEIAGAINATRILTAAQVGKVITVRVTASNARGSSSVTSAATIAVVAAPTPLPVNTVLPVVSGTGLIGDPLTTTNGSWTNSPTSYSYQWREDGLNISGATAAVYVPVGGQEGKAITCRVSAINAGGAAIAVSNSITVGGFASDYTISTDADWATIPAGLLANGGVIAVRPGNYSSKTITADPSALLIFRGQIEPTAGIGGTGQRIAATGAFARIDRLILEGATNIALERLEIVSTSWQATPSPAVQLSRINANIHIHQCLIHSGYRGAVDTPHDVLNDLPEYACMAGDIVGGVVTALEITRSFVGGLLAPGTYPLSIAEGGGTGFNATFTVTNTTIGGITGNHITATNLISGGSGYSANIHRTRRLTFAAQQRMSDWLAYGIQNVSLGGTTANQGGLWITDNVFHDLSNAIKPAAPNDGSAMTITGNSFYRIYQDYFSAGLTGATIGGPVYFRDNFGTLPFSKSGDAGDPHSDWFQLYMNDLTLPNTAGDWVDIFEERNVFIDGNSRGGVQGNLVGDNPAGIAFVLRAVANLIMSKNLQNVFAIDALRWAYIAYNTLARYDPTNPQNSSVANLRINDAMGRNFVGGNIIEATLFQAGAATLVNIAAETNVIMGQNGATIPYPNVFAGGTLPTTKDEAIAYFASKPAFSTKGAGRANYVNWAARTLDETMERTYFQFTALAGQPASSAVWSDWCRVMGGPANQAISVTNGSYQIADTAAGANATAEATAPGTVARGKFVRVKLTNAAGSSVTTTATLTIGGYSADFTSTTVSTAVFDVVAFDGSDRFIRSAGALAPADGDKLTIAFKLKFPASNPSVTTFLFGSIAGTAAMEVQLLSTGLIRVNIRNAAGSVIAQVNHNGGSLCNGAVHEVMISIDTSQATAANGRAVYIDGVDRTSATGTWVGGAGVAIGYTRTTGAIQYSYGGTATAMIVADHHYFWLNPVERIDISSPANRAKFAADQIGDQGEGPSGNPVLYLLKGNAAAFNTAAGINRGTGAKFKGATGDTGGTGSVTDVAP